MPVSRIRPAAHPAEIPGSCSPCCGLWPRSSKLCGASSQPTLTVDQRLDPVRDGADPGRGVKEVVSGIGERPDQRSLCGADSVRRKLQLRRAHADQNDPAPSPEAANASATVALTPTASSTSWPDLRAALRLPRPGHPRTDRSPRAERAHRVRRDELTSDTASVRDPRRRAASRHACPIGPPPMTSTRSSGRLQSPRRTRGNRLPWAPPAPPAPPACLRQRPRCSPPGRRPGRQMPPGSPVRRQARPGELHHCC